MAQPDEMTLFAAMEATWPCHALCVRDGWAIRDGRGGGKRVSAATRVADGADIALAEAHMMALGQTPLFMIRPGEAQLDEALAARGYGVVDPVVLFAAPIDALADPGPAHGTIRSDAPVAVMREIWARGDIGPGRLAVMARVEGPRACLLARDRDRPAACCFAAIDAHVAMVHALQVDDAHRRKGLGARLMRAAAHWAQAEGANRLALAVTRANDAACGLYRSLGMIEAAHYHYRQAPA